MSDTQRAKVLISMIGDCYKGNLLKTERDKLSSIKKQLQNSIDKGKVNTHMIDILSMEVYQILG